MAIITFHPNVIPEALLRTIAITREGVPFRAFVQALLMGFFYEAFREGVVRAVGQSVGIVGALILGEAAVNAGVVSPIMIIIYGLLPCWDSYFRPKPTRLWFPCLNKRKDGLRAIGIGMSISGGLLTVLTAAFIAFTGTSLTPRMIFPIFYMSRYILIGNFLMGLEAIFMLLWLVSSYLEILVFYYPAVVGLGQWLNLKDYKPLILPMTVITIILALIPSNMIEVGNLDALKNPAIIIPLALLILLTWLIAIIRNKKEPGNS